jgi:transmembrane sensor
MEWRSERDRTRSLFDEALHFVDQSKSGIAQDAELIEWASRSPDHVSAFLEAWNLWRDVASVTAARRARIDRLATELAQANPHVVWLDDAPVPSKRPLHLLLIQRKGALCGAALVVASLALGMAKFLREGPTVYETGDRRQSFVMSDGTYLHLNSDTRVQTRFRGRFRDVDLLRGEALFDVERDPRRPFRVASGGFVAQSQDARFDLQLRDRTVSLLVIQGQLSLARREAETRMIPMRKGQLVRFDRDTTLNTVVPQSVDDFEISRQLGWTGHLTLNGLPLREAIEAFNRNNRTKIQLGDPSAGAFHIGGTFNVIDPDGFVLALRALGIDNIRVDTSMGTTYRLCAAPCVTHAPSEPPPAAMF